MLCSHTPRATCALASKCGSRSLHPQQHMTGSKRAIMATCHSGYLSCSGLCTCAAVQLREDVTRFRYGDEQHLDDTLTRLFQFNRPKGVPRRRAPLCQYKS